MSGRGDDPEVGEERVSRSQLKREMLALQRLGERLMGLSPEQWRELDLSPALTEALEESGRIRGHGAMRRHTRRLGKLLRREETAGIEALFERMENRRAEEAGRLHRLERWRERLLDEGDEALQQLLVLAPGADRQRLRQLIRDGRRERERGGAPVNRRKLFRYLRELDLDR